MAVALAAAVAGVGAVGSAGADTAGTTGTAASGGAGRAAVGTRVEVVELQVRNEQYEAVDLGPAGPSLGDLDVYSGTATSDGRAVGRGGGTCRVIHVDGGALTKQCLLTMELDRGSLTMQSLWTSGTSPLDMAVTGGTGDFHDARGTVRFWDIGTPDERIRAEILH